MTEQPSASAETSQTLAVHIDRSLADVFGFVSDPENLPKWAAGLARSIRREGGNWIVETPQGAFSFRMTANAEFGILDHYVQPPGAAEVAVPMRVVAHGAGCEVLFTLLGTDEMTDEARARDVAFVKQDLATLKRILEG